MTKGPYTNRRLARSTDWSDTTLAQAEIVYDKTKMSVRVGDGSTVAGRALNFDNRTEILQPNQISANTDNYAPTGLKDAGVILMSADADRDLTGIDISVFPDGIEDRYISIAVSSSSPGSVTIKDQSTNSSASNRFQIGRDLKMTPGSIQLFRYIDGSVNRWVWFGVPATALTYNATESLQTNNVQSALNALQGRFVHTTSVNINTPPSSPAMGDTYVVGTSPTGVWSAQAKTIAVCSNATGPVWTYITPTNDVTIVYSRADGAIYRYTSSAWSALGSGINDGQILAVKLDTSTAAKRQDFRTTQQAAPSEAIADHNLIRNPGFEGGASEGSASGVTLTATGTLQAATIVDGAQGWYRGSFVAAMQQVASPFVGGRYAIKTTVSLGQASLGSNDELSIVLPISGAQIAKLAWGGASASAMSLGFWFQAHRTGSYSGSVRNVAKTRSYPFSFTVASADTPQWVSLAGAAAIAGDTGGTWTIADADALYVTIALGAGSSRVGTSNTWAGADYSGATSTTNGVAATSDVFYVGNVLAVPGAELPEQARAALGGKPFREFLRVNDAQALSTAQQAQARANINAAGLASTNAFTDTTDATSSTAASQTVAGGLGVAKKLFVGGSFKVTDTTASTSTTTGSGVFGGGVGIAGGAYVGGKIVAYAGGHILGAPGSTSFASGVANSDATFKFFDGGSSNWSGMGQDGAGNMWLRTALSGTPLPNMAWLNNGSVQVGYSLFSPILSAGESSQTQFSGVTSSLSVGQNGKQYAVAINATGSQGIYVQCASSGYIGLFAQGTTSNLIGSITNGTSSVSYNITSDERLKNFEGYYDPSEAIRIIRADPVRAFSWKESGERAIGWGAQTSYAVENTLASPGNDLTPGEEGFVPWGVDQGKRTPYLWAAVSRILDRLDTIEQRFAN